MTNVLVYRNSPTVVISRNSVEQLTPQKVTKFANLILQSVRNNTLVIPSGMETLVAEKVRFILDTTRIVTGESPTPTVNGVLTVFTVANPYVAGTLEVTRASLRMHPSVDFSETSETTFTMVVAPESTEPLIVDYIKK